MKNQTVPEMMAMRRIVPATLIPIVAPVDTPLAIAAVSLALDNVEEWLDGASAGVDRGMVELCIGVAVVRVCVDPGVIVVADLEDERSLSCQTIWMALAITGNSKAVFVHEISVITGVVSPRGSRSHVAAAKLPDVMVHKQ